MLGRLATIAVVLLVAGCSGDVSVAGTPPDPDAGSAVVPDVAPTTARDAAPDLGHDVAADAGRDVAPGADPDAGEDAAAEAGPDGAADAGDDADAHAGSDVAADVGTDAAPVPCTIPTELGENVLEGEEFVPMREGARVRLGTCEFIYHAYLAVRATGAAAPPPYSWGTATIAGLSPDAGDPRPTRVFVLFDPQADGTWVDPATRLILWRRPEPWIEGLVEVRLDFDDPALCPPEPVRFTIVDGQGGPLACCAPCANPPPAP